MVSLCRYFVLDFETGILQYFVNEQSKHQKPRGALSLSGAIVSLSDEAPHMLVVYAASGEVYKLRGTCSEAFPGAASRHRCGAPGWRFKSPATGGGARSPPFSSWGDLEIACPDY